MKYMLSTLCALIVGIGLAHAQSEGSSTPDQGPAAGGTSGSSDVGPAPVPTPEQTPAQTPAPTATAPSDTAAPPAGATGTGTSAAGDSTTAAWPAKVQKINIEKGRKMEATASLANGYKIDHLSLPASCIAQSDAEKFSGKHVIFGGTLPADTDVAITVSPNDATKKLSVYAYTLPADRFDLPGEANNASSCESSTKAGFFSRNAGAKISLNGAPQERNLVVGVAGGPELTAADFKLTVEAH